MRVLLFDNDEEQLSLLQNILGSSDYDLVVEQDPEMVFNHFQGQVPEMVISNFEMPNGGIDLVNAILASTQKPYPYILFLTGENSEKYAVDCLGPVPGDFITKPLRQEEFLARIIVAERTIALQNHVILQQDQSPDLAMYDDITNLLNRQAVYERALGELNRSQRDKTPVCLALMEITNIDAIEETHGEKIARQAIRFVARAIKANIRIYDIVGRWMDARFIFILPGLPIEYTKDVVGRIYGALHAVRITLENGTQLDLEVVAGYTWSDPETPSPLYVLIEESNTAIAVAPKLSKGEQFLSFSEIEA